MAIVNLEEIDIYYFYNIWYFPKDSEAKRKSEESGQTTWWCVSDRQKQQQLLTCYASLSFNSCLINSRYLTIGAFRNK